MCPITCQYLNGRLRIALDRNDTNPSVIMAYATTMGAVTFKKDGPIFHLRGWYGEPADITEETLRRYLDPAGTCAENGAGQV